MTMVAAEPAGEILGAEKNPGAAMAMRIVPTRRLAYATRGLAGSRWRRTGGVWRGGASGGAANEAVRRSAATGP